MPCITQHQTLEIQQVEATRNMIFIDKIRPPQPIPNPCFSPSLLSLSLPPSKQHKYNY